MITKGFNLFLNVATGLKSTDTHGMKVIRRERIVPIARSCVTEGWTFDTELVIRAERAGIKTGEIPVRVKEIRPPRHGILRRIPKTMLSIFKMLLALRGNFNLPSLMMVEERVREKGEGGHFIKKVAPRSYYYESIAHELDRMMNLYDLEKRLRIVFDLFLDRYPLEGKSILDLGCGTGWFSMKATERGGRVFSLDIGMGLLLETRKKCQSHCIQGNALILPFADRAFDLIICSELIEHTTDPRQAVRECARATTYMAASFQDL